MSTFNLFLTFLLLPFCSVSAAEVGCEKIIDKPQYQSSIRMCDMRNTTSINSRQVVISDKKDEKVKQIEFSNNRKISFLPVRINEKMPKLESIFAKNCSISEIFKANFEQLSELGYLDLNNNQIEVIGSDTFEGLGKLRMIYLGWNKIKSMNGKLFEEKPELIIVGLRNNVCIDQRFQFDNQNLIEKVNSQCGLQEVTSGNILFTASCGRVSTFRERVIGGTAAERGQWPFLVALVIALNGDFFCGGNLISAKHVLTAAHCVHPKNLRIQYDPDDVVALVGRYNLKSTYEHGAETRGIQEIFIHPDWKYDEVKYDGDLATLVLERQVEFSNYIQPICLTNDPEILKEIAGTVVGWGKSESGATHENIPRQVAIRAVNDSVCFDKDYRLGAIYSQKSFCAGGEGVGPCTGDSGGGFFVNFKGSWTLKGIVSAGAVDSFGGCNVERFSLFTKLNDFSNWIRETVERTK